MSTKNIFIISFLSLLIIFSALFDIQDLSNKGVIKNISFQAQTAAVSDFDSSLIAHYAFDGDAADSAGSHAGITTGGPVYDAGKIGQAISFDGAHDYITTAAFATPSDFSLSVWINIKNLGKEQHIAEFQGMQLYVNSNNKIVFGYSSGNTVLQANTWYLVTVVNSSSGSGIYINGSLDKSGSGIVKPYSNPMIYIGRYYNSATWFFDGMMDDLRIYNRSLYPDEIQQLYSLGGGTVSSSSPNTNPDPVTPPDSTVISNPPPAPNPDQNTAGSSTVPPLDVPIYSSEIIPSDRRIDWTSNVGIPGGIPVRTNLCANVKDVPYNAKGDGTTDDYLAIQKAVDDCPTGQVVYLPQGTYMLSKVLSIRKGIVLRGAGNDKTLVNGAIAFDGSSGIYYSPAVVSGATKGSTRITVTDPKGFVVGTHFKILGTDDPSIVHRQGYEGLWPEALSQAVEVTGVSGNTIDFKPALFWSMDVSGPPKVTVYGKDWLRNGGIESLKIRHNNSLSAEPLKFLYTAYSWAKDVEIENSKVQAIYMIWAYDCQLQSNYIHDSTMSGSGGGYGILLEQSTGCLVENNASRRFAADILVDDGSVANVIAYNYQQDLKYYDAGWNQTSYGNHSSHPMFTLWEGNVGTTFFSDDIHGSASHQTLFRNRFTGWVSDSLTKQNFAVAFDTWHYDNNVVGNILGTAGKSLVYEMSPAASAYSFNSKTIYALGYAGSGQPIDPKTASTLYRHGNFDYVTQSVIWNPGVSNHSLPASLYYSSRPSWYPSSIPWPAIGPDVSGLSNKIPAQLCFEQGKMPNCFDSTGTINPAPPVTPSSTADFNHDGLVNSLDFSLMITAWNQSNTTYDLNKDGTVNTLDYSILIQHWTG